MADEITEKLPFQQSIAISEELPPPPPLDVISSVAPPGGAQRYCTEQTEKSSVPVHPESSVMNEKLRWIEQQLQYLLNKADKLQAQLVNGCDHLQKESLTQAVHVFLRTCQPWFAYLESTARSCLPPTSTPSALRSHPVQMLRLSQQLCTRLEQLVLMNASLNFLSVEETEPSSYFLCYEDVAQMQPELHSKRRDGKEKEPEADHSVRRWSGGQWVQTDPDPVNADLF